jgi:protein TonB
MFETVAPEVFVGRRDRLVLYESLPLSIGLHVLAVAVSVSALEWRVFFPDMPPKLQMVYGVAESPSPAPPPPIGVRHEAPKTSAPAPATTSVSQPPAPEVAPAVIPETTVIEQLPIAPAAISDIAPPTQIIPEPVKVDAQPEGLPDGLNGGVLGKDGRVHFGLTSQLPLISLHRLYPEYPEEERKLGFEDDVVVRYVVGKDGKVKEVRVLIHPHRKPFEESTLKAMSEWQFRPLIVDGQTREVVHSMVVRFRITPPVTQ